MDLDEFNLGIPDSYYNSKYYISKYSCEDVLHSEEEVMENDVVPDECPLCKKVKFLFNGHDYKSMLENNCCFECYVKNF